MASKREDLLLAAKKLLWEWDYEGTSPRDIQESQEGGVGVRSRKGIDLSR